MEEEVEVIWKEAFELNFSGWLSAGLRQALLRTNLQLKVAALPQTGLRVDEPFLKAFM